MDLATFKKAENTKEWIDKMNKLIKMINDGNEITISCGTLKLNLIKDLNKKSADHMTNCIEEAAHDCLEKLEENFNAL